MNVELQKENLHFTVSSSPVSSVCASCSLCSEKRPENYKAPSRFFSFSGPFLLSSRWTRQDELACVAPRFFLSPKATGQVSVKWLGWTGLPGAPLWERGSSKEGHRASELRPLSCLWRTNQQIPDGLLFGEEVWHPGHQQVWGVARIRHASGVPSGWPGCRKKL